MPQDNEFNTPRNPPAFVSIDFGARWSFILPEVYRFEDEKWIDAFFDTGVLRLSNFAKFSSYDDEARGDQNEGQGLCSGRAGDREVGVWLKTGQNSFVFSCGLVPHKSIMRELGRDSAFVISNPLGFAVEIARQLPGCIGGFSGNCIYRDPPMLLRHITPEDMPQGPDFTVDQILAVSQKLGGEERYLLKHPQYELQREYRFIWHVDHPVLDFADVIAPLARQHCRRIDSKELR